MLRWIEKARNKPKSVRNQYAFVGAVGVTGLIALIWTLSIPAHFSQVHLAEDETARETVGAFSKFFSHAKQNVASVIQSAKDATLDETESVEQPQEATTSAVVIPELDAETILNIQEEQELLNEPKPRTVLIATSSQKIENISTNE